MWKLIHLLHLSLSSFSPQSSKWGSTGFFQLFSKTLQSETVVSDTLRTNLLTFTAQIQPPWNMKLKRGMEFRGGLFSPLRNWRDFSFICRLLLAGMWRSIVYHFKKRVLGNKCAPWLFLKTIPPPLACVQTSKVNTTSHREKHGHSYLLHFVQNTVFFLFNSFWACAKMKIRINTHYINMCFFSSLVTRIQTPLE